MEEINETSEFQTDMGTSGIETLVVFIWVLTILGLLSNLLSLFVLFFTSKLRRNRYYRLIICMSVSDVILNGTVMLILTKAALPDHQGRKWTCLGLQTVVRICFLQTFFQVFLIASERCIVSTAVTHKNLCSGRNQAIIMTCTWLIAIIYCSILAVVFGDATATSCDMKIVYKGNQKVFTTHIRVVFFILLICVSLLYIITIIKLFQTSRKVRPETAMSNNRIGSHRTPNQMCSRHFQAPSGLSTLHKQYSKENKKLPSLTPVNRRDHDNTEGNISYHEIIEGNNVIPLSVNVIQIQGESTDTSTRRQDTGHPAPKGNTNRTICNIERRTNNPTMSWHVGAQITAGIIILILIVTYLPCIIDTLLMLTQDSYIQSRNFGLLLSALPQINTLINPILYLWRIQSFRNSVMCKTHRYSS